MKKLIFALTCLLLAIPCQARIITVDNDGTADFTTIQAAIDDSNDGDTIIVTDGIYTGDGNRDISFLGKAITLRSENGPLNCIIDCNGTETNPHRGFIFHNGEDGDSILFGLTITNGYAENGGGIHCYNSSPTISECVLMYNKAGYYGGGIHCYYNKLSNPSITKCIISENKAVIGGGLAFCDGLISECVISKNQAGEGGGLTGCGGQIKNCIINGNIAHAWAGGLQHCDGQIVNCIVSGNTGGGVFACNGEIRNCTVVGNTYDGFFACWQGPITNCIIRDNYRSEVAHTQIYVSYSNIKGAWPGEGNIDKDPFFINPGYWDANGTPDVSNDDFWVDGDYHLKSQAGRWDPNSEGWVVDDVTSPCIDAGNPGCPVGDEPAPNGNRINMGAYGGTAEASKSPTNWRSIADLTNDWFVNSNDLKVFVDYWLQTSQCTPGDLNRSQFVDFNDFALFGQQWSYPSASEPGIFYQVQDCNMEEGQNQPSATDSNDTRFSVWVEGNYIHFKDLITANCCLDEIELQMTVEDGLITIYEIEHLTTPCFCLCDYPTTAILGPFEPGIYLLEVIDIDGKSLGIAEVTIGGSTEPGITYQIEDCNRDASDVFAAEPPDLTRFTVTVEGLYIHFKDMMTANCCPDKLELEMAVEDNLITIYETEYTSEGCRCICSFPITATLGPFEPGTYTLEVYETMGGFIGSTTITIGTDR